jgi:hypothetical protein
MVGAGTLAFCTHAVGATPRSLPAGPVYGVTVDDISNMSKVVSAAEAMPYMPTTRVYLDPSEPAGYYSAALAQLAPHSYVMAEILDSSDMKSQTVSAEQTRVNTLLSTLSSDVDIWEVGNEVNGNWTGDYATVAEKLTVAFEAVTAAGGRTALTLYANNFGPDNCGDGNAELTPLQFSEQYVPANLAAHVDYVLLSYYPTQCGGREPSSAEVASALEPLHAIYPNAALGFGEVGLPRRATRATRSQAEQIMRWAYALAPGLPYYAGGYFWWYGAEDALRARAPLRSALRAAFESEAAGLS